MKLLEKYIVENRENFGMEEPDKGHFDRFEEKHRNFQSKQDRFSWKFMLQAAVVTLLVVLSALWVYDNLIDPPDDRASLTLADISPEYREAEIYYTTLINRRYNEIRSFDFHENSAEQEIVINELAEMDTIYKSLEEELDAERGNHMVISAMIRHYQLKLDIMGQILEHLYEVQTEENLKIKEDENISI
jgi:hypothetical protein